MAETNAELELELEKFRKWNKTLVLHSSVATASTLLGAVVLSMRKGTPRHKLLGRLWVGTMLTTCATSYKIQNLNKNHFSWIHGLSTFTIGSISSGIYYARTKKIKQHKFWMVGSYIGTITAGFFAIALPGRHLHDLLILQKKPTWEENEEESQDKNDIIR